MPAWLFPQALETRLAAEQQRHSGVSDDMIPLMTSIQGVSGAIAGSHRAFAALAERELQAV